MQETSSKYKPVEASPVKSFFVNMLTRDIKLEEAILDLLDNCVDGILRSEFVDNDTPYKGRWAKIEFNHDSFKIADNCGGIPWCKSDYAFRLGRHPDFSDETPGVMGVYGIGMKRAIFKMGTSCSISTKSGEDEYKVNISSKWMKDESDWEIPVDPADTGMTADGTIIVVKKLHEGITTRFNDQAELFQTELINLISSHYSLIIDKGFSVSVNGQELKSSAKGLIFDNRTDPSLPAIRPFIFRGKTEDEIEIFLAVGFSRRIPTQDEMEEELEETRYSSEDAGWSVICNDRTVVYCDRTELTGWGEERVPRYHTQFIAVYGVVEFRCDDPSKLPTTTTKRGVDASSPLYLRVKNKMREGMKVFTDYTNDWKGSERETRTQFAACESLTFDELRSKVPESQFNRTFRSIPGSIQYRPDLPSPKRNDPRRRRISYMKEIEKVELVSDYLAGHPDVRPTAVGEACFEIIYDRASE